MSIKLKARIVKEVYHRDNFFILSAIPTDSNRDIVLNKWGNFSIAGNVGYLSVDSEYELILSDGKAGKYGMSYEVEDCPTLTKQQLDSWSYDDKFNVMKQATTSDRLAKNILTAYPNFINDVVTKTDDELKDVIDLKNIKGVGEAYYSAYKRILRERFQYFVFTNRDALKPYQLNSDDAKAILSVYPQAPEAEKAVLDNPYYVLTMLCGHSFFATDSLLKEIRPDLIDSDERCEAVIIDILKKNEQDGNTRLNGNTMFHVMRSEMYNCGQFASRVVDVCDKSKYIYFDKESKDLSVLETYMKEVNVASFFKALNNNNKVLEDLDVEKYHTLDNGVTLTDEQLKAVENFKNYNVMLVQGCAGAGKSTSTKAIVDACKDLNLTITALAPTGCAAMRLSECINMKATTIHLKCFRDKEINTDVVIVDESSMIDLEVFDMLIKAIKNNNIRIILIGDTYQLTPVGIGTPFADLVNSEKFCVTYLTKVFRYGNSGIAYAGENARQGKNFLTDDIVKHIDADYSIMDDWKFLVRDGANDNDDDNELDDITLEALNQYKKMLAKGVKKQDILGATPFRASVYKLNNMIQAEFNPSNGNDLYLERKYGRSKKIIFRVGDRVINKKNNYQQLTWEGYKQIKDSGDVLGKTEAETTVVYNGQRGDVVDIVCDDKGKADMLVVKFENELVVYDKLDLYNLELSYFSTYHSLQGQESPNVIAIVPDSNSAIMTKNLLYVGGTRAKKNHIYIGSPQAYINALKIDGVEMRNTWLLDLINN